MNDLELTDEELMRTIVERVEGGGRLRSTWAADFVQKGSETLEYCEDEGTTFYLTEKQRERAEELLEELDE